MAKILEHKKFVCVEFGDTNNNKLWQYTLYDDGTALTEWGRIGGSLQSKQTSHSQALTKMREKTNPNNKPDKLYTEVKAVNSVSCDNNVSIKTSKLADIAKTQIKHTNPIVQSLIDYLVKVNSHQIAGMTGGKIQYDDSTAQFKTPLGVIDSEQVKEARNILVKIADIISNGSNSKYFDSYLNQYLRLIPHDVGMHKISKDLIFPDINHVQKENDLLDGLETSFAGVISQPKKDEDKKDDLPKIFDVEMAIVTDDNILSFVKNLYQSTRKAMHASNNLSVKTVYKIDILTMKNAFDKYGGKLSNIKKLWHGTKASNLLSIFKQGLIIPPASSSFCTGRMFGNGVYFSDISTKALNYATNYWVKGGDTSRTFMFISDVAMGKMFIPSSSYDKFPKSGYDSTFAQSGVSGVQNNEMIVYNTNQCNLIYLVEFCPR